MDKPASELTHAVIERNMRHAHELRSRAVLDAIGRTARALRRGLKTAVSVFA